MRSYCLSWQKPFGSDIPAASYPRLRLAFPSARLNEEDGWLADQSTWMSGLVKVASYAEYVGDKSTAGWLLNENMAQLYRAFATYDKPVSIQFPSSPLLLGESLSAERTGDTERASQYVRD